MKQQIMTGHIWFTCLLLLQTGKTIALSGYHLKSEYVIVTISERTCQSINKILKHIVFLSHLTTYF